MSILVSVCCNDDHGHDRGLVDAVEIRSGWEGHSIRLSGPEIRWIDNSERQVVKVGRRLFGVLGPSQAWSGNLFWDSVKTRDEALRLLAYLLERGYSAEEWTRGGPFARVLREFRKAAER